MRLRLLLGALVARVTTSLFAVGLLVLTADAVYVRAHSGHFRGRTIAWCSEISVDRADVCCCAIPCQVGRGIAIFAQFLREVSAGHRSLVLCYAGLAFLVEVGPSVVCQICCFRLANRAREDFVLANLFLGLCLAAILGSCGGCGSKTQRRRLLFIS
jgi:hypothetical protein